MNIDKVRLIDAVSFALDYLEIGAGRDVTNHNRRVALFAINVGRALGLSEADLSDLYIYAMLHDNGITNKAYYVISEQGRDGMERAYSHCEVGERNIRNFPFNVNRENIIKYHHEAYDGTGFFGIRGDDIPLLSQIIAIADYSEILYRKNSDKREVEAYVLSQRGKKYSDTMVEAFLHAERTIAFWLGMNDTFVSRELDEIVPHSTLSINSEALFKIAAVVGKIIDAKSPFTGSHSQGIAKKIAIMSDFYGFAPNKKSQIVIAAYLHDVGKLVIPNEILDKPAKLTADEFDIIKAHVYYTKMMLSAVPGFEDITGWACNHHEKLNGTGYPYGLTEKDLSFEAQLMGCIDIYQALTENRPYRGSLSHDDTIAILKNMALNGEVNSRIVNDISIPGIFADIM
ncbi:MAG: HD domain-containing phosphohydrolase [Oscillospiraceae bacterium]